MSRWRPTRTLAWGLGFAAAVLLGLLLCEAAGWPFMRGPLQRAMQRAAHVPVVLDGHFHARLLWQPRLEVGHLRVGAAPTTLDVPFLVDGQQVELAWRWSDLWRWHHDGQPLLLRRLHAATLDAHLVRDGAGRASWHLGADGNASADPPRVASLAVGAGRIAVDDRIVDTRLQVELRGEEGSAAVAPGYAASASGTWRALPLKLQARAGAALPLFQDDDETAAPPVALRIEGTAGVSQLVFDGHAAALLGARRLDGQLQFRGPSLARVGEPLGLTLPHTAAFDLAGRLRHDDGVWQLRADHAVVGRSHLAGDFRYDARATPGRLSGRLEGTLLALADLGPAVGAPAPGQPTPAVRPGRVLPQRQFDLPSLRTMDADVQVAIDALDFGTPKLAPLRSLRTHLLLEGGVLQMQDLHAVVAGGQVSGSTQLDGRSAAALWRADLQFRTVDIAGWIRGLQSPAAKAVGAQRAKTSRQGGDPPVQAYLTGALTADVKVSGRGRSTADILGSLQGRADLLLRDGTLSHLVTEALGLDIAQAIGVLVRGDRPLPLRCARVDLALDKGVAVPRLAVMDNSDSTVRFDGRIDLRDESLALRAVTRPKDFSPLSLRAPITIDGTLGQPRVGIEASRLAARGVAALALATVVAPAAALLPFVDPGSREAGDPCSVNATR